MSSSDIEGVGRADDKSTCPAQPLLQGARNQFQNILYVWRNLQSLQSEQLEGKCGAADPRYNALLMACSATIFTLLLLLPLSCSAVIFALLLLLLLLTR